MNQIILTLLSIIGAAIIAETLAEVKSHNMREKYRRDYFKKYGRRLKRKQ